MGFVFLALLTGAIIWMSARILRKAGLSDLWAVTMIVPLLNTVAFWVFAFVRWPSLDGPSMPDPPMLNPPDEGPPDEGPPPPDSENSSPWNKK